jgi:hypothetical protein
MIDGILKSLIEISTLLSISHGSNNKYVAIHRNGQIFLNPSAKSTILAWQGNPMLQYFLFETCGDGDGAKTAVFILTSLLKSFNKNQDAPKDLPIHEIDLPKTPCTKEHLIKMSLGILSEQLPDLVYEYLLSNSDSHISIEIGDGISFEVVHSEAFRADTTRLGWELDQSIKGAMVALFDYPIFKLSDIRECLENVIENRPIVIVAPIIGGEALKTINLNTNKGVIEAYALEYPKVVWQEEWAKDFSAFTGAKIITRWEKLKLSDLGSAQEILFKEKEILVEQYDDHIEKTSQRIDEVKGLLAQENVYYLREILMQRISNLQGSLLRLKVGGITRLDAIKRRVLCEKLIYSLAMSVRGGVLEDGLILSLYLNANTSCPILNHALQSTMRVVMQNTGIHNVELLDPEKLKIPFPRQRAYDILKTSTSVALLLGSTDTLIQGKKK